MDIGQLVGPGGVTNFWLVGGVTKACDRDLPMIY